MKLRTSVGVAMSLAVVLTVSACADGESAPDGSDAEATQSIEAPDGPEPTEEDIAVVDAIEVTGDPGQEPEVSFDEGLVSVPTSRILDEGDGDELVEGMRVTIDYVAHDAEGERLGSTWEPDAPESFRLGDPNYDLLTGPLVGQQVGVRLLLVNPVVTEEGESAVINVVEVVDARFVPERAEGDAVEPAEGLPTVTLAEDGEPSLEIPDGYESVDDLVVQTLIEGGGAEVGPEQTVLAHYTGWTLDGDVFDSSWERNEPSEFSLQLVIEGWTEGLSGQTVGSQVLLVIPAEQAYGAEAEDGHQLAGEDLIFVVDILDAS